MFSQRKPLHKCRPFDIDGGKPDRNLGEMSVRTKCEESKLKSYLEILDFQKFEARKQIDG